MTAKMSTSSPLLHRQHAIHHLLPSSLATRQAQGSFLIHGGHVDTLGQQELGFAASSFDEPETSHNLLRRQPRRHQRRPWRTNGDVNRQLLPLQLPGGARTASCSHSPHSTLRLEAALPARHSLPFDLSQRPQTKAQQASLRLKRSPLLPPYPPPPRPASPSRQAPPPRPS